MTKKKKTIIIVTAVALVIAITLAIVLPLTLIGGKRLQTPKELAIVAISGEPSYEMSLSWQAVDGAEKYVTQYRYELYPNDPKPRIETVTIPACTVKRIKGAFQFRVMAVAKNAKRNSDFSEWYNYDVKPLLFELPSKLVMERQKDYETGKYGYKPTEDSRNDWTNVKYTYKTMTRTIDWYEVVMVAPNAKLEDAMDGAVVMTATQLKAYMWHPNQIGKWKMCIRAVNYYIFNNTIKQYDTTNKPELFNLYEVGDDWTEIEFTVVDK